MHTHYAGPDGLVTSAMASDAQPHVALLAFPFASHPAAFFALARALAAAAPGTAFSFLSFPRSLATLAPAAAALGNLRLCPLDDGFPSPPPESILDQIDLFLRAAPGNLREGLASAAARAGGLPVSSVVSDAFLWMVADVAEGMGVPWVPLWIGGISSLSAHIHTDLLRRTIGVGEQAAAKAEESLQFIPGLSATRVRDLPEGIVLGDLDSAFAHLLHRMGNEVTRATALAVNSFEGLEPAIDADYKATFKEYLPVGPINLLSPPAVAKDDESDSLCLTWLDRQGPATVAYISFGTIMSLPTAELAELAEALEATAIPFLWSMKEQLRTKNLPAGFLDRTRGQGLMVSWAPQLQVLGHPAVGAFVTHCGWNSVMESISSGVPMLCRPLFGDHMMAERMVTKALGIGVGFEGRALTREAAVSSLIMVFKEEEGKKIRERACEVKAKAITAVKPDGSSAKNFNRLLEIVCGRKINLHALVKPDGSSAKNFN